MTYLLASMQWGIVVIIMIILTAVSCRLGSGTNSITLMLTSGTAIFAGLYTPDAMGSLGYSTIGVGLGLLLIAYSFFCVAWAYASLFKTTESA
jgi:hypothetical protein